jgi:uncharacterized membrane protein
MFVWNILLILTHYITYMASVQYNASWGIEAFHLREQDVKRKFIQTPGQEMSRDRKNFLDLW